MEFELLDENMQVVYSELKTDTEGKVEIKHLVPGKYYIRETKPKEGYELYDKLIDVQVAMNEQTIVTINSNQEKTEGKFTISKKVGNTKMNKLPVTGM
ncbi:MAG: hypothetical protein HFJ36_03345 [Clostridia bacterium]|nr:hypothetical protein [Clostridia bacterium]